MIIIYSRRKGENENWAGLQGIGPISEEAKVYRRIDKGKYEIVGAGMREGQSITSFDT